MSNKKQSRLFELSLESCYGYQRIKNIILILMYAIFLVAIIAIIVKSITMYEVMIFFIIGFFVPLILIESSIRLFIKRTDDSILIESLIENKDSAEVVSLRNDYFFMNNSFFNQYKFILTLALNLSFVISFVSYSVSHNWISFIFYWISFFMSFFVLISLKSKSGLSVNDIDEIKKIEHHNDKIMLIVKIVILMTAISALIVSIKFSDKVLLLLPIACSIVLVITRPK